MSFLDQFPGGALAFYMSPELWAQHQEEFRAHRKARLKENPLPISICTPRAVQLTPAGLLIADDAKHQETIEQVYREEQKRAANLPHATRLRYEFDELQRTGEEEAFSFSCASRPLETRELIEAGLMMGFWGVTHSPMSQMESEGVMWAALWTAGIFCTAGDETPFFDSIGEAYAWYDNGGMIWPCQALQTLLLHFNPDLFKATDNTSATQVDSAKRSPYERVKPWEVAPVEPVTDSDLLLWSAYWAPLVAERLGTLRECSQFERPALRETALALPILVGVLEREHNERELNREQERAAMGF
jgi:hypothetical protein